MGHLRLWKKWGGSNNDKCGGENFMMGWYGPGYGMGGEGFIFMMFFWVLIIIGIVYLFRWGNRGGEGYPREKTPLQILQERYAKGEIDKKEYEEKKKELS